MTNFQIGLSALRASQFALNVTANNLANANTEGYHRQRVEFVSLPDDLFHGFRIGRGVDIGFIHRLRNQVVEASLTSAISDLSFSQQRLTLENQMEALLHAGSGSINEHFESLFNDIVKLSSSTGETVQKSSVVERGLQLSAKLRQTTNQLFDLKTSINFQIEQEIRSLNADFRQLAEVQQQIQQTQGSGAAHDLLDRRDQIINRIASVVDVTRQEHYQNGMSLSLANHSIQLGQTPPVIESTRNENGEIVVSVGGLDNPISLHSGRLAALVELHNETISGFQNRLDQFAGEFIRQFDQVHATGLGLHGGFSTLTGNRSVDSVNAILADSGTAFPIDAGELFFNVTDPNGNRRTTSVSIDPETQSLQDVANAISGIDNVQAVVDANTGKLQIIAQPGYQFDFTGRIETIPGLDSYSGDAIPKLSGSYDGAENQSISFQIVGDGTVGITEGLSLQVFNESGEMLEELNIGKGYEAGSDIKLFDNVSISIGVGDVVAGDTFETTLVANSDSTGILSALGLNSFFVGQDAHTIDVDSRIANDPDQFAFSLSGDAGDTANLLEFIALRESDAADGGRVTFDEFLNEVSIDIGIQVQSSVQLTEGYQALKDRYELERASYSGVDLNEEAIYLAQFQKSYEAAVRVIETSDAMLDDLFSIIR